MIVLAMEHQFTVMVQIFIRAFFFEILDKEYFRSV